MNLFVIDCILPDCGEGGVLFSPERVAWVCLSHFPDLAGCAVGVRFVDDVAIAQLHGQYLDDPTPTDVMTFPLQASLGERATGDVLFAGAGDGEDSVRVLGEIVISYETLRSQAVEWGVSEENEAVRLVVHGVLHLLGYNDGEELDRERMHVVQEELVREYFV